jgi:glycerol-3-phosphate cytidylyltransferase
VNVLTIGTFDLFHYGHVRLLDAAADFGPLTVGLNSDEFVEQFKGRRPILPYEARREVLAACRFVTRVIPNSGGADAKPCITEANPTVIVVGSDWADRDYLGQLGVTHEWLDERGILIVYVPYTEGISASMIRAAL